MNEIIKKLSEGIILLDGAMGTMLQDAGLPTGDLPELLCFTRPELIRDIHISYLEAGADIIYANTFGANQYKIKPPYTVQEVIKTAVEIALEAAAPYGAAVALDIGSLGKMFFDFDEFYESFVPLVIAGEEAGADLVVFETMSDLCEMRAAILAAKENTNLPIIATMTFEKNGRSFTGVSAAAFSAVATGLGVDGIGLNCSLGPEEVINTVKEIRRYTNLPMVVKPNAGLPDQDGRYSIGSDLFARYFDEITSCGVNIIGGCCGTTPQYIAALKHRFQDKKINKTKRIEEHIACSATKILDLSNRFCIVGERLNPTGKKRLTKAILDGDIDFLLEQAVEQDNGVADLLDINVGAVGVDEQSVMKSVVGAVQKVMPLPLMIDSSSPEAIEAGLRAFNGIGVINSVNGDRTVLERILPIAKKYGAFVVGLCLDENGIPEDAEKRSMIAKDIADAAMEYGIPKQKIIIDCLTLTVSAQQKQAKTTLKALTLVKEMGLLTLLGVSNISFGLPERELINTTFLTMAVQAGLNLAIMNPNSKEVMRTVSAIRVISGEDENSVEYIDFFAKNNLDSNIEKDENYAGDSLKDAVIKGLISQSAELTKKALQIRDSEDIIQQSLIPALDIVGERFEKGIFFLPQLISSANAAEAAFNIIKQKYKSENKTELKEKIVICTVKGDIHDIGKNIVKTLLENYGYEVIDLGKDVSKEEVEKAVIKDDIKLVGLSALMTTTLVNMAETIEYLRQRCPDVKIMVGGAVLNDEIAKQIGADFYAHDAKRAVDIAENVFA